MANNKELIFTRRKSDQIVRLPNQDFSDYNELVDIVKKDYDFIIGYIPEGYNSVFLLQKDDKDDSRNDEWKLLLYNRTISYGNEGTITLDNMDAMENSEGKEKFEITKVIEGNYEDIINASVDLIKKYREENKEESGN